MKMLKPAIVILVFFTAFSGCGYNFTGSSKGALQGVTTLAIEFPLNRSARPGLEGPINKALKRRFLEDGSIKPAPPGAADALLRSSIISYREEPFAYRSGGVINQYKAEVELEVELISDDLVLLRRSFLRHRLFSAAGERLLDLDVNRKAAVERIAADLAGDVYVGLQEAF